MKKLILLLLLLPVFVEAQIITTFAGDTCECFSGDGGPALAAGFDLPGSVRMDKHGNFYIADIGNYRVRKVDTGGIVTTVAGNGVDGYSGDGWLATSAAINTPNDMAFDKKGNMYIVDLYNSCIRKVDTSGIITTVIGQGLHPGYYGDGGKADTALINSPVGIAIDTADNIYITDWGNYVIRKIDTAGIITTYAGNGSMGYSGDGGPASGAEFYEPCYLAFDKHNNLYIADAGNNAIRKIDAATGIITSFLTGLAAPPGITIDVFGNLYFSDGNSTIHKVDTAGTMTLYAGNDTAGFSGDGGPAIACELDAPQNMCTDDSGNLYIADMYNDRIRKIYYTATLNTPYVVHTQEGISIYPNPATTQLTIQSTNKPISQIIITNLLGQVVYTQLYNLPKVQVDVSALPAGAYFIKVNGAEVRKFVKE